ncbi:MAG: hypothetical protein ACR2J1_00490 [Methyloceanibacter sp.]|uniref:hypothetical protein n=1 Tax=Methyloceanibacter sp. TaxID=1965321 RepID=UPI003D9B67A6
MPQILILVAAGAGMFLARKWYRDEQRRIAGEVARAREAMEQREEANAIPLVRDPATGVYRPRQRAR